MTMEWRKTEALTAFLIWTCCCPVNCENEFLGNLLRKSQQLIDKVTNKRHHDDEPGPIVVPNFVSNEEATTILQRYEHILRSSAHMMSSQVRSNDAYRTSKSVRVPLGDPLVVDIEKRAANLAGFGHDHCEDFQLACYNDDELYGLHRDDAYQGGRSANRAATVLIYLHSPDSGGETLFTRRPLEEERDLDTKRKLHTQAGALKLFRSYCNKPKRHHVVVPATVGTAVTWKNWYGDHTNSTDKFASRSTHGACPVKGGKKCAIQIWISKTNNANPLRSQRVAAIFPSGADVSFRGGGGDVDDANNDVNGRGLSSSGTLVLAKEKSCFNDTSAKFGRDISDICFVPRSTDAQLVQLGIEEGPHNGVGSWRIAAGELQATFPANAFVNDGFTVSFWVRGIDEDTTMISISSATDDEDGKEVVENSKHNNNLFHAIVKKGDRANKKLIEFSSINNKTSTVEVENPDRWSWMSISMSRLGELNFHIYDWEDGRVIGQAAIQGQAPPAEHCSSSYVEDTTSSPSSANNLKITLLSQPIRAVNRDGSKVAFAPIKTVDVSFIIFHDTVITSHQAAALRHQARRYDVNT